MTNNNWEALLKRKTEYLMKAPCMIDEADLRSLANSFSELKDQEHKAELEMIRGEIERLTHYYRSKFSPDCSRNETDEEKSTEMITKEDIKHILDSHINKLSN